MAANDASSIDRRTLLKGASALGLGLAASAMPGRRASAAGEITVADPGGPYAAAFRKAFYEPFEKATGIRVINVARDTEPVAQFKAVVESRSYIWDVCNLSVSARDSLQSEGLLEPIGITAKEVPGLMPAALTPSWLGTDVYGSIFAYRTDHFAKEAPASWADFWNVQRFPGRRSLFKSPWFTLEQALLADGVAPDKLYPLDVDRGFHSLDRIKPHISVWWTGSAQASQLLESGEVEMIALFSGRAQSVIDAGAPAKICWNQGIYGIEGWGIPKGTPRADAARQFVKFCADARRQAVFTEGLSYGPSNLDAYKSIPVERARVLPTYEANLKLMTMVHDDWWAAHRAATYERFNAWILA